MPDSPKIRVADIHKAFGKKKVLHGISLDILGGESLVVVGGSGAGKTVFLKHLIGLLMPDQGRVVVDGLELGAASAQQALEMRKRFGMSFQEGALFDSMTVFDNVAFPIKRHTARRAAEIAQRVHECLTLVRLEGVDRKLPAELSGGMRRRVGFARAIALEPEILLFDEPTTGLDPINTAAIAKVINGLRNELDVTIVSITHDMSLAFRIADRIAMMRNGSLLALDSPDGFSRSSDPYVQAFLRGELPEDEEVL
jgi:phospholipid/cholesterol/gamma-HCH transport system ATP-binding protein